MAQPIRTQAALPKDLSSRPRTHVVAYNCLSPVPGDVTSSSGLHGHQVLMRYTDIKAHKGHKIFPEIILGDIGPILSITMGRRKL